MLLFLTVTFFAMKHSVLSWPLDLKTLTEGEQVAIDKLRTLVESELTSEYMEEDAYLIKWLSAKEFNVDEAAKLLRENLKWRRDQKIDTILKEDWTKMEHDFPYERDTEDMQGRPILYFHFGNWNIHKLMTEEDSLVTLGRYLVKIMEESEQHVRKLKKENEVGSLSPLQLNLIISFEGYDIWNQGCFQCLHFYRGFCQTIEAHFPRSIEKAVLINVPTPFEVIYWYIEAVLAEKTRGSIKLYGNNRRVWQPAILSYIEKDQVPGDLMLQPLTPEGDEYITTRGTPQ